ncbi:MAG: hypothetical protein A2275_04355 [Bacteroidetes bacterium RIFOXYA12_FULL_35_11]|nr:MAG: hypothetical protein A2X01_21730 [Bacteroidetes bacterium GWF2_35_48]OFY76649.1 MAG: hypothetical protein A2275_04355 [Bacteroidetes bacterium RIFOXYA12_FULL_35_11]OFY96321.1 MAG: hypothetical protein A2309_12430 [Bacteroidetes bacterium RIFOXYB2_FULL_35_7]OFZ04942.1 MAG: hypothetical protein A2491_05520 [Bacteroidetes bacterium RIFOXYC12_FULL_35_7]HBX51467.1 hypothetical protein [Bacteroidales bacterium]
MKLLKIIVAIGIIFSICTTGNAQKLKKFGMDIKKKHYPVIGDVRIPYTDVIDYFGYVKPGEAADETKNGKKYYYVYVWIPIVAPEIGIRMVSPVTSITPGKNAFISPSWEAGKADKTNFFDTWISFERAEGILSKADVAAKGKTCGWHSYGQNDDSSEMPKNPAGRKYNSLLRITSEVSNPLKALVVGLYRIGFTTYKVGEVQGSFMAQIGAPIKLPGVVVAKDIDSLLKIWEEKEKEKK